MREGHRICGSNRRGPGGPMHPQSVLLRLHRAITAVSLLEHVHRRGVDSTILCEPVDCRGSGFSNEALERKIIRTLVQRIKGRIVSSLQSFVSLVFDLFQQCLSFVKMNSDGPPVQFSDVCRLYLSLKVHQPFGAVNAPNKLNNVLRLTF